jgi:hypothetical protein
MPVVPVSIASNQRCASSEVPRHASLRAESEVLVGDAIAADRERDRDLGTIGVLQARCFE